MEISKLNGKPYYLKDVARVEDQKQQKLYIKHDVYPVDMYTTTDVLIDENTGEEVAKDKLIMVFSREESKPLYILWKNRELKQYEKMSVLDTSKLKDFTEVTQAQIKEILSYKDETKPTDEMPKMVYKNKNMK